MKNRASGFEIELDLPYENALEKVTECLKSEGFGVLTSIDVRKTLHKKLGVDFRPYTILGACNPPLAYRALTRDPWIGLMLPCNVTVEAIDSGSSIVRIIDPQFVMQSSTSSTDPELSAVALEAKTRLERVAGALQSSN